MSSEEGDTLIDQEKRYLNRRRNQKFEYTNDKEDKGKPPLLGEDEEKEYPKLLIRTMQDIAREIKEMKMDRYKDSHKLFLHGEGSDISHHWSDQPMKQQQVSQRSTMPTFLAVGNEGFQEQETLEHYFMEYESQSQRFKDHLSFQEFCQIKENRRPMHHNRGGGFIQNHDLHQLWAYFSYPNLMGHLNALPNHG